MINVFLDSDGTLVDFEGAAQLVNLHPREFKMRPGAYLNLRFYPEALKALQWLLDLDEHGLIKLWIATKPPTDNPYACAEKVLFFQRHIPQLRERIIITPDKSVLGAPTDFLVDDRPHKANASEFQGTLIVIDSNDQAPAWNQLMAELDERGCFNQPDEVVPREPRKSVK